MGMISAESGVTRPVCRVDVVQHPTWGLVLKLKEDVLAGEDIVVETPLLSLEGALLTTEKSAGQLAKMYAGLTAEQKKFVSSLSLKRASSDGVNSAGLKPEVRHFKRVLKVYGNLQSANRTLLFQHISLAVHSCASNAAFVGAPDAGMSRLFALRDAKAGEVVTLNYLSSLSYAPLTPFWKRQELLRGNFLLECRCDRCSADMQQGVQQRPSKESLCLLQVQEALEDSARSCEGSVEEFRQAATEHLSLCWKLQEQDDAAYHLFNALTAIYKFELAYFLQSKHGDAHLVPALQVLAQRYECMPASEALWEDSSIDAVFLFGSKVLEGRPDTRTRSLLQDLWRRMGSLVRDRWGAEAVDYQSYCDIYQGVPDFRPSINEVIAELKTIRPCSQCGAPTGRTSHACRECSGRSMKKVFRVTAFLVLLLSFMLHRHFSQLRHFMPNFLSGAATEMPGHELADD